MINRARGSSASGGQLREFHIGDELVEDRLYPHQTAGRRRLRPGNAHEPAHRRHAVTEQALQRDRRARDSGQDADDRIGEMDQRDQHDQHGADVEGSRPAAVRRTMASMVLDATFATSTRSPPVRWSMRSGTMIRLTRMAAGAPITEAMTKWAAASGIIGPSKVA